MRDSWGIPALCWGVAVLTAVIAEGAAGGEDRGVTPSPNQIFVTSVTGTGDLSTWADSGGVAGLAGADAVCQARATAASLEGAALFVAWMSDSVDDAYCRVHGMTGKKATNCGGLPDPPSFAGPWVRTDLHPFSPAIHGLVGFHGNVYIPVSKDEFGIESMASFAFSATDYNGEYKPGSSLACSDWTSSASGMVPGGSLSRTTGSWTDFGQIGCANPAPLICLKQADGPPIAPLFNQGALAFLTHSIGNGRLEDWPEAGGKQGLEAGDNICRLRASAAGLPHPEEFKAWLSTSSVDAADRFTFGGPWVRPDGVIVAQTRVDLVSGQLHSPINQTAFGVYWGNQGVWTGSTGLGAGTGAHCVDWSSDSSGPQGTYGLANAIDEWSEVFGPQPCSGYCALYCLSNVPGAIRVFFDGFESGGALSWSTVVP
jgi:hypothetical protein